MRFSSKLIALSLALATGALALVVVPAATAQTAGGRVVLVLPFDNRSGDASLDWIGDSFPNTLDKRFDSANFLTISQEDRKFAYDHLGLPTNFKPSHATAIVIAQQLDANYIIVGSFNVVNGKISIQAQVLSVNALTLTQPVQDGADLKNLYNAENAIAWKVARVLDPHFNIAESTFIDAPGSVPLPAFENYIRGTNATTPDERLKRLQSAVTVDPTYASALLALGKEQYSQRDYTDASATLAKVPKANRLALEANFYLGLSRFNSADYAGAETAFGFVAQRLPLPEVVNDQAVALSRQGKDGTAYYQRASDADPSAEDYHYNLALSLFRRGDTAEALKQAGEALKLKPNDDEAGSLRAHIATAAPGTKLVVNTGDSFNPVERVRRNFSEASFRQAAFQIDQMRAVRMAMMPTPKRAAEYNSIGAGYFDEGLLPEAEHEFQSALEAEPNDAAAHAGIAQIRAASGSPKEARTEAETSIRLQPNAAAYLVLAHLDIAAKNLPAAANDVAQALRTEPNNSAAIALRMSLQERGQVVH